MTSGVQEHPLKNIWLILKFVSLFMLAVACSLSPSQSQLLGTPEHPHNSSIHPSQVWLQMCPVLALAPMGVALGSPGCHSTCPEPGGQHLPRASMGRPVRWAVGSCLRPHVLSSNCSFAGGWIFQAIDLYLMPQLPLPIPLCFLSEKAGAGCRSQAESCCGRGGGETPTPPLTP